MCNHAGIAFKNNRGNAITSIKYERFAEKIVKDEMGGVK